MRFSIHTEQFGWVENTFPTLIKAKLFVQNSMNEGRKVIWKEIDNIVYAYNKNSTTPIAEIHREN